MSDERVEIQVALKVLKKFENQAGDNNQALFREALVWGYLRHQNIANFFGVDLVTLDSPALVSPWYTQGNILKCMVLHSPTSLLNVLQLCGIISGLQYLHSVNMIHGDLCAVIIDDHGRPCLTDFGLTGLIEPDAAFSGGVNPGGSTR
ncbi:kinase-like domain-containing protein [Mycena capillaripes]|nr:kinase-like domain-containing protein [Mycena capillaripes]